MRTNSFTKQFLAEVAKSQKYWERYEQLSDEEKRQLKLEQERERECLNNIVEQVTGSNPSWF